VNTLVYPRMAPSAAHSLLITGDGTSFREDVQGIELLPVGTTTPTAVTLSGTYDAVNAAADLTWTGDAGYPNTLEYVVQRATDAAFTQNVTNVATTLQTATGFNSNLPLVGQQFWYRVESYNSSGSGTFVPSNIVGPFQAPAGSGAEAHYYNEAYWAGPVGLSQIAATVSYNAPGGSPQTPT